MSTTKKTIAGILAEIEGVGVSISSEGNTTDEVMEILLGRKSEYEREQSSDAEAEDFVEMQFEDSGINAYHAGGGYTNPTLAHLKNKVEELNRPSIWNKYFHGPENSKKPIIGPLLTLIKKIIYVLIRPIVRPIIDEQTVFNASTVQAVNELLICIENNSEGISRTDSENRIIAAALDDRIRALYTAEKRLSERIKAFEEKQADFILKTVIPREKIMLEKMQNEMENRTAGLIEEMNLRIEEHENLLRERTSGEIESRAVGLIEEMNLRIEGHDDLQWGRMSSEIERRITGKAEENIYNILEYDRFENRFRGTQEDIKHRQEEYMPYMQGKKKVIDLGCGRGEFLELLRENGVPATGVDTYTQYVNGCRLKGLDVFEMDALAYMNELKDSSIDGLTAFQLIEHLKAPRLAELCGLAYKKLVFGGTLIFETPNPHCLSIYANSFYIDLTHEKPVHPETIKYMLEEVGFSKVEILYTQGSRVCTGLSENNEALNGLFDLIYGSQDYAVIATK